MRQNRAETIKRHHRMAKLIIVIFFSLTTKACVDLSQSLLPNVNQNNNAVPTRSVAADALSSDPSTFAQITDVPIPANAKLNVNRSIILGGQDMWTGRAEIETPYSSAEMFDFFKREMVTFGWSELTSVRSDESVITFLRGKRIATVQIFGAGGSIVGSVISLTVAPVGSDRVIFQPNREQTFTQPTPQVYQQNAPIIQDTPSNGISQTPLPRPQ